jgi:S1-C subfamily serine protease
VAASPVGNVAELLSQVAALAPGQASQLQVLRDAKLLQLTVNPGIRPMNRSAHPR